MADPDKILNTDPDYVASKTFSTADITGTFDGLTQGDVGVGDIPVIDFDAEAKVTKEGVSLYPINSEFGFIVADFDGAIEKDFFDNPEYAEGFAGDLTGPAGEQLGLVISDAPTDTFKTPALLGTWLAGLGGNTVKASTEHYVVMQNVLSDQLFPNDPDALYALDNDLIMIGGDYDGYGVADLLAGVDVDGLGFVQIGDENGDGVADIKDILEPNESTIQENIAASADYSVTLKDDGKLLYRWGNTIKRPNDVRLEIDLPLPDEWAETDSSDPDTLPFYRVTSAELVVNHTVTNNPNDQIRPEDYENEAAIGQLPTYTIVTDYNEDGEGAREVWVSTDDYYSGDGTLYPAGTILKDQFLADKWAESDLAAIGAEDGAAGYTNAWYTTMDREPFEADLNDAETEYDLGPRWRLQTDKYGQDLPSVVIPLDPSLPPPPTKDEVKYEVGDDTTTVINLLDWGQNVSPLSISAGYQNAAGSVTENGVNLTSGLDVAFYIKGDIKPATIYNAQLVMSYGEVTVHDTGAGIVGTAADDYLVGQGGNTFTGGEDADFFVLSYGTSADEWSTLASSAVSDFEVGTDTLGLIGLGVTEANFDSVVDQTIDTAGLKISLGGNSIASLAGVTEALDVTDFVLLNPSLQSEKFGTAGNDLLVGTPADNLLSGLAGDDTLIGRGGEDTLEGGEGNDILLAEVYDTAFDPAAAQVFRLYETAFDRMPDRAGHYVWSDKIAEAEMALDDVADGFANSQEFDAIYAGTSNTEYVTLLYQNALDRDPDAAGLAGWVSALDNGTVSRTEVLLGFSESDELQHITRATALPFSQAGYQQDFGDDAFRLIKAARDAAPTASLFEGTSADLAEGNTFAAVAQELLETPEAMAIFDGTSNTQFVTTVYENVLNRLPDAAGLAAWTAQLDAQTLERADVLVKIAESVEAIATQGVWYDAHMVALGPDDVLNGGTGDDVMFGGILADVFQFNTLNPGNDQVAGLEAWDTLEFSGFGYASSADALGNMSQAGNDVLFEDQGVQISFVETELSIFDTDMFSIA